MPVVAKKLNITVPDAAATAVAPSVPTVAKTAGGAAKKPAATATSVTPVKPLDSKKQVAVKVAVKPIESDAGKTDEVKEDLSSGETLITGLLDKVGTLATQIKAMQSALKQLAKEFDKQKKIIDKVQKKKEKAKKSPSGFAKPCKISDELCTFIGIPKGTEQSRTDITRFINAYVKEHNLNNPENRREFFPDAKLKTILNVNDGEKVTYFILQRLIAHHFPPSMSKLAAAKTA
jgi:chromatin remodeling complex protein RSC6